MYSNATVLMLLSSQNPTAISTRVYVVGVSVSSVSTRLMAISLVLTHFLSATMGHGQDIWVFFAQNPDFSRLSWMWLLFSSYLSSDFGVTVHHGTFSLTPQLVT